MTTKNNAQVSLDDELLKSYVIDESQIDKHSYPCLRTISSAFIFQFQAVPNIVEQPEYVYIPERFLLGEQGRNISLFISEWNMSWESAQARFDLFGDNFPKQLEWLEKFKGNNIYLIPYGKDNKYGSYSPIYNLLPIKWIKRYRLPFLQNNLWPASPFQAKVNYLLPTDIDSRLSGAFGSYIWPLLNSQSKMSAYDSNESIKILAHNLDYWVPHINKTIEERMRAFPTCDFVDEKQRELIYEVSRSAPTGIVVQRPLKGGLVWEGEEDAWEVAKEIVETADKYGKLREIIDAIKSNRVEDDFSDRWSYEKEDFERKLFNKRSKFKVKFVELDETISVQGHETEVTENIFWEDFMGLLDKKEKQVVVLIRSGYTKLGEVSSVLGYANHSPVSKALKKIRKKLEFYIDNS